MWHNAIFSLKTNTRTAMLKRFTTDFVVKQIETIGSDYILLTLKHPDCLPQIDPGQFVEVRIPDTAGTFLRRPISVHDVDYQQNTLTLLIRVVGNGTAQLSKLHAGESINLVYPLGNGFDIQKAGNRPLLIGGGVGVAPMLYLGKCLKNKGANVEFLFGARSADGLLRDDVYKAVAPVNVTTEDGSLGTKGFVVDHNYLRDNISKFTSLLVCGPTPMMRAVAKLAQQSGIPCYLSLENKMACGIGVCLCCVTDTKDGHKCVCSEGPVFEANDLKWE